MRKVTAKAAEIEFFPPPIDEDILVIKILSLKFHNLTLINYIYVYRM